MGSHSLLQWIFPIQKFNGGLPHCRGILYQLGASLVTQLVKNPPAMQETWVRSLCWEDSLEKGPATQLQYSGLENPMNCIVHGVAKSWTGLSDVHFHFSLPAEVLELVSQSRHKDKSLAAIKLSRFRVNHYLVRKKKRKASTSSSFWGWRQ